MSERGGFARLSYAPVPCETGLAMGVGSTHGAAIMRASGRYLQGVASWSP